MINRDRVSRPEAVLQEVTVPKGQVNQIFLSDGTRIWINSESKLLVPSVFSAGERVVKLSGEAFFQVARDERRPFLVEVEGQQIEVLGTSFNLRAYDNSEIIETTLEDGSIKLTAGDQKNILNPGDQSIFDKNTGILSVRRVNPKMFTIWRDGRYVFENEKLTEVFKVVERWYDVEIIYDEKYFSGMFFSGVIKRNKDAKHFLELLNLTIPVRYEIESDKIKISLKPYVSKQSGIKRKTPKI
jgi:ferric-dicitrate binding protein FerR (iron transport regulator)